MSQYTQPEDTQTAPSSKQHSSEMKATLKRIANLALVGKALIQRSSSLGFETDYYIAKQALKDFEADLNELDLDEESRKGMHDLIAYLAKKVDKRLHASLTGGDLDDTENNSKMIDSIAA